MPGSENNKKSMDGIVKTLEKEIPAFIGKEFPGVFLVVASRHGDLGSLSESQWNDLILETGKVLEDEISEGASKRLDKKAEKSGEDFTVADIFAEISGSEDGTEAAKEFSAIIGKIAANYAEAAAGMHKREKKLGVMHQMCRKARNTAKKTKFSDSTYKKVVHDAADKIYGRALGIVSTAL